MNKKTQYRNMRYLFKKKKNEKWKISSNWIYYVKEAKCP